MLLCMESPKPGREPEKQRLGVAAKVRDKTFLVKMEHVGLSTTGSWVRGGGLQKHYRIG